MSECAGSPGPRSSSRSSASRPQSLRGATRRAGWRLCSSRSSPRRWSGRSCAAGPARPVRASALARRSAGRRCFATCSSPPASRSSRRCRSEASRPRSGSGSGSCVALLLCARTRGRGARAGARGRDAAAAARPGCGARDPRGGPRARRAAGADRSLLRGSDDRALALAVFTSGGLPRLPRASSPAIATLADHPAVAVEMFDEVADRDVWERARDPRQPVLDRARPGRDGARQGDLQQPGAARERRSPRRAAPPSGARGGELGSEVARDRIGEALDSLAGDTSRRGFLARVGAALVAGTAGGVVAKVVKPGDAGRLHELLRPHLHDRLVHPPARPAAGRLARLSDPPRRRQAGRQHRPAGEQARDCRSTHDGSLMRDPDGLPAAAGAADQDLQARPRQSTDSRPIRRAPGTGAAGGPSASSGTAAPTTTGGSTATPPCSGYCYGGRKVFCVTYYQTHVPC